MVTLNVVHKEIERQIDQRIDIETDALLDYERDHGFEALVHVVANRDRRAAPGSIGYLAGADDSASRTMGYILTDRTGRRRAGSLRARMPPPGWTEFMHFVRPDGSRSEAQVLNSPLASGGRLVVAGDRAMLHRMDALLFKLFGIALGVLVLWGALMVILFGRVVRRRLAAIERSATAIIAGDITRRIPLDGSGVELDRLALLLNRMLDRIGQLIENLRAVTNGLAHDLRTPLSRLHATLEQAASRAGDATQRALLETAMDESDALLDLFAGLLAVAEIDGRTLRNRFVAVDLSATAAEIAEAYGPAFEDAGMALVLDVRPVMVSGDRTLLHRLVANLLDNVLRHAASATRVALTVTQRDGKAMLRVTDDGPGIPASEHERVFERFVRLDTTRATPGHGLGLSLVAAIASAHEGSVTIQPSTAGLAVELELAAMR